MYVARPHQHHGPAEGLRFLSRMQRLTTIVSLVGYAPSVGLDDCLLPARIRSTAESLIADAVQRHRMRRGSISAVHVPYRLDEENSEDAEVSRLVQLRTESEAFVTRHALGRKSVAADGTAAASGGVNQIALFAMLATKGSVSNLIQCCHSLGQQIVGGESRLPLTDHQRVFPHDPKRGQWHRAESQGLLWRESFIQGLSPLSFFIHAIAGREALVEGATSTAQSGYSMRLGVKAMESTITEYDYTVRDGNHVIQYQYNGTGLDPERPADPYHRAGRSPAPGCRRRRRIRALSSTCPPPWPLGWRIIKEEKTVRSEDEHQHHHGQLCRPRLPRRAGGRVRAHHGPVLPPHAHGGPPHPAVAGADEHH